jgi:hypothetical protein
MRVRAYRPVTRTSRALSFALCATFRSCDEHFSSTFSKPSRGRERAFLDEDFAIRDDDVFSAPNSVSSNFVRKCGWSIHQRAVIPSLLGAMSSRTVIAASGSSPRLERASVFASAVWDVDDLIRNADRVVVALSNRTCHRSNHCHITAAILASSRSRSTFGPNARARCSLASFATQ